MKIDEFLKDEKIQTRPASQDGSLDDDALDAVSGGLGDCYVDIDFGDVVHRDYERKNRYDERNDSIVRRTNYGDISDDEMISFQLIY